MTLPEILLTRPNIAIVQENREGWKAWYNDFACEIHWLRFWNPACKIITSSPGWTLTGPKPSSISLGHWTFEKSAYKRTLWSTCHQNNGSFLNRNVISYISFHLVCPLCPIFFEQRVTEISYHRESPSTVPKCNFGKTTRLGLWNNRSGIFIIRILRDKFNAPFVVLNCSPVRLQVCITCW